MSKQIMKPVWRVNSGNGVPSDLGKKVMFTDGVLSEPWDSDFTDNRQWKLTDNNPANYSAYQTTRTKAAKYKRVECRECWDGWYYEDGMEKPCYRCNEKGYTLEAIK